MAGELDAANYQANSQQQQQLIKVRLCRPEDAVDFAEIDRLERECAQGTILRFHFASNDPKNPRPRALKYQNNIVTVAENADGRMVGTISGAVRSVRFGDGRIVTVGWVFSLRVGLDQRRTGVASRLIVDMEQRMRDEFGVKFVFDDLALDNIPSVRLFEKLGYTYLWKARLYGINISHTNKMLALKKRKQPVEPQQQTTSIYSVSRLDSKQSRSFLHKHYSKTFLYPEESTQVLDSNVYVACSGENLVGVNVWTEGERMGIIAVPLSIRLLYYVMIFLSFLFPNFFEKPLPLSRPWMMRFAYPILVDCSSRDKNVPRDLFNAAVTKAVADLQTDGTDVLMIPAERAVAGLSEANTALVKKYPFVSPLMRGTGGLIEIGKSLLPENDPENAEILSIASKQPFWFLNNSI